MRPLILRDAACAAPRDEDHTPPILQTYFHSSAVTGCTDSREYFTSAMAESFLSALIAAIVTGVFNPLSPFFMFTRFCRAVKLRTPVQASPLAPLSTC